MTVSSLTVLHAPRRAAATTPADDDGRLWLGADGTAPAAARAHVAGVLRVWGVDEDCVADAVLLTSELVSNVVEHTSVRSVGLAVTATDSRVIVSVQESGTTRLPDPDSHMLADFGPGAAPRPGDLHGRGLRILDALAVDWGISRTHRCTSTWFALAPTSSPPLSVVSPAGAAQLDAVQASLRRTQLLLRITEDLGRAVTAEQVGDVVTTHLREHLGAMFTGIALVDPHAPGRRRTMSYLDLSVFPGATRDRWTRFDLDIDAPVGAVVLTRTASFLENLADAETEFPGLAAHMTTAGTLALAHLPLLAGGRSVGTLALAWREARAIDADTRALLTIVAGYAAQALSRFAATVPSEDRASAVARAERRLADARAEFDAAIMAGVLAAGLADRELEITRAHEALLRAQDAAAHAAEGPPVD